MDRRFDHGELNLPLRQRQRRLNAQIDQHKAKEGAELRKSMREGWALQRQARAAVRALSPERLAELGGKFGITGKQAEAHLLAMADRQPELTIRALAREAA